jgi:putative addiction module component (TIGR02574 family)
MVTTSVAEPLPAEAEQAVEVLLQLSPRQRMAVSQRLDNSLSPAQVTAAWSEEIGRRVAEIEAGEVTGIPVQDVFRRIEERLDAKL